MVITAVILLRENIKDFTIAAQHMEREIESFGLKPNDNLPVPTRAEVKFSDLWLSKKTVSLFNLGIALELMLKLVLLLNESPKTNEHSLTRLYDSLPRKPQNELERAYQKHLHDSLDDGRLISMRFSASVLPKEKQPPLTPDISTLRNFFDYFDSHASLYKKRYAWEDVAKETWNYYIDDISLFVNLINDVLVSIRLK